jgi:hypothetical protein
MFIELTQVSGTPIPVNADSIRYVMSEGEGLSLISLNGPNMTALPTRESYAEVLEKLRDCGAHTGQRPGAPHSRSFV